VSSIVKTDLLFGEDLHAHAMGVKEILLSLKLDEASCLAAEHLDSTLSIEKEICGANFALGHLTKNRDPNFLGARHLGR
jgi:hypothetical protein